MREETQRTNKYKKKIISEIIKERAQELRKMMIEQEKEYFKEAVKVENEIKNLMANKTDKINAVYYIIFAKEILKLMKKHKGESLINEVYIIENKWKARGLNEETLKEIEYLYLPIIKPIPTIEYFRLDISVLDGPDVLA
jgi:sulfur transfer complex TusBCD TusB component (DsrH family)